MKNIKRIHLIFLSVVLLIVLAATVVISPFLSIGVKMKDMCTFAKNKYRLTCTESLMRMVQDSTSTYRQKNDAVWALGQLADKQALPLLKAMYTGAVPPKEDYDAVLSQHELQKAIKWCEEGNSTSWMYKNLK